MSYQNEDGSFGGSIGMTALAIPAMTGQTAADLQVSNVTMLNFCSLANVKLQWPLFGYRKYRKLEGDQRFFSHFLGGHCLSRNYDP